MNASSASDFAEPPREFTVIPLWCWNDELHKYLVLVID